MINLDFSLAIALLLFLTLVGFFTFWMRDKKRKENDLSLDPGYIWHCSVCAYTYVNTKEEIISICPRCGSYNKKTNKKTS